MIKQLDKRLSWLLAMALVSALWSTTALAELRAFFDRPTVYEGDRLTLTIEVEGNQRPGEPELSVLDDAFDVLGISTGSQISIVNGRRSDKLTWQISLMPKITGKIEVPPIQVGTRQTSPLTLTVSSVPQGAQGGPGDDLYIEVALDTDGDSVMVQQQIPVVVRLYSALPIRGGELTDPRADGAVLERLGEDTQYQTTRNGRNYQVIERRFSLSPERSGKLRIAPVVFKGELLANRGSNAGTTADNDPFDRLFQRPMPGVFGPDPFSMFQRGQPVRAQAQAIELNVKPRPAGFGGKHWLPAEAVAIDDSWAKQVPRLRVGEPVTRTLTITAKGLAGTQIPEIEMPVPEGMRAYPEKIDTESRTDGAALYAVSTQRVTLIPTVGGRVEMPEIPVPWWDTVAEIERIANVPAIALNVEGPVAQDSAGAAAEGRQQELPMTSDSIKPGIAAAADSKANELGQKAQDDATMATESAASAWLSRRGLGVGLLAILLCMTALLLYRRRRLATVANADQPQPPSRSRVNLSKLRDAIYHACVHNDPAAAAKALLAWAQVAWSDAPPTNLAAVSARLLQRQGLAAAQSAEQVTQLERHLYASDADAWNGEALWLALKNGLDQKVARNKPSDEALAPLYPQRL